jgi:choline dehydrogenase-like flavoprotein
MSSDFDVAVLGGGFAGLICARELARRGLSVVVVEKRDGLRSSSDRRLAEVCFSFGVLPPPTLTDRILMRSRRPNDDEIVDALVKELRSLHVPLHLGKAAVSLRPASNHAAYVVSCLPRDAYATIDSSGMYPPVLRRLCENLTPDPGTRVGPRTFLAGKPTVRNGDDPKAVAASGRVAAHAVLRHMGRPNRTRWPCTTDAAAVIATAVAVAAVAVWVYCGPHFTLDNMARSVSVSTGGVWTGTLGTGTGTPTPHTG